MDLLTQLGVDSTLGIQFLMFLAVFVILKQVLFEPYYAAFVERKERTLGKTELAERFIAEARELEVQYGVRAQQANDRFREIYDRTRNEAIKEYDRLVNEARAKSKSLADENSEKIGKEMETARKLLSQEIPNVSKLINQKLVGQELGT